MNPIFAPNVNSFLSVAELLWNNNNKKDLPHTSHSVLSLKQTDSRNNVTLCCLIQNHIDLRSFWFAFSPLTSQIFPHRLFFWKIAFRQFKDASCTRKLFSENITLKYVLIPFAEMRHYVGVEWSGEIRRWKMTLRHELSVSVAQRETSGWTQLQRTQTQLRRLHKSRADSLQNKRHQLCWLLTQFARGLIQFQSQKSYSEHVHKKLIAMQRAKIKKKWWKKGAVTVYDNRYHPMNTLHCYLFGHCT